MWQARHVAALLQSQYPGIQTKIVPISTAGDTDKVTPLSELGGKGVFIRGLEEALIQNQIDIAVHSLKDVTSQSLDGLDFFAFLTPESIQDALVTKADFLLGRAEQKIESVKGLRPFDPDKGQSHAPREIPIHNADLGVDPDKGQSHAPREIPIHNADLGVDPDKGQSHAPGVIPIGEAGLDVDPDKGQSHIHDISNIHNADRPVDAEGHIFPSGPLGQLPLGSHIGTGSLRRIALLQGLRPDIEAIPIRGNIETRMQKVLSGELAGILLSEAGLKRMGVLPGLESHALPPDYFIPAPGQGVIVVQGRGEDFSLKTTLSALSDPLQSTISQTQLRLLKILGFDCRDPFGIWSYPSATGLSHRAFVETPTQKGRSHDFHTQRPASDLELQTWVSSLAR